MAKYIEPVMHLICTGFYLVMACLGLSWQIFGFSGTFCLVAAWPPGCLETEEIECERGGPHEEFFGLWLTTVPYMCHTCLILLALIVVAFTVLRRYYQSKRFEFSPTLPVNDSSSRKSRSSNLSQETKQVVTQCILYALHFGNTMVWSTLGTILWLRGVEYNPLTDSLFAIDVLAMIFFPSQGFFLFLIFLRPRYLKLRRHYDSPWTTIQHAVWNAESTNGSSSGKIAGHGSSSGVAENLTSLQN